MNIDDVAKEAGVSAATVSRVINNHPGIAEKTALRVRDAIARLGYVPPPPEKRVRKRKNFPAGMSKGNVAFFVPDSRAVAAQTQVTSLFLDGISEVLGAKKIELQFLKLESDGSVPAIITEQKLDGIICKNWPKDPTVAKALLKCNPVWCLGTPNFPPTGDRVEVDPDSVAELISAHASGAGCDHMVLLDCQNLEFSQKARAYSLEKRASLQQQRLSECPIDPQHPDSIDVALDTVIEMKGKAGSKPAVVLESAEWLYAAFNMALLRRGLQIGKDLELICIAPSSDGLPGLDPNAVVIDLRMRDLGVCAAETLLWRLANPNAAGRRVLVQPEINLK